MTALPFELEQTDPALLVKALKAYRPQTTEEEGNVNFLIDQFEKMTAPEPDDTDAVLDANGWTQPTR